DAVIDLLVKFPELIELAAQKYEPHLLCYYLKDLAHAFHSYYNYRPFLVEDAIERNTRLVLVSAVLQVLRNGLNILDLSAPEKM
ncbi:MAG: arginine--tRNA ligase, partial [Gammaproteobacteria bacterium]|nr:arginine--tRNA ligase [Gammaproteobacteria bacterium]